MKPSAIYLENAEICAQLAEGEPITDSPAYKRYRRMEAAWRPWPRTKSGWTERSRPFLNRTGKKPPRKVAVFLCLFQL